MACFAPASVAPVASVASVASMGSVASGVAAAHRCPMTAVASADMMRLAGGRLSAARGLAREFDAFRAGASMVRPTLADRVGAVTPVAVVTPVALVAPGARPASVMARRHRVGKTHHR